AEDVAGVLTATGTVEGDGGTARELALAVRDRLPAGTPGIAAIGAEAGAKGVVVVAVNRAAKDAGHSAATIVKGLLGGRGGGSPDVAQGGGIPASDLSATLGTLPSQLR